ncbi:alpha-N-acetylgalactosaminide alpha-2,6-sialyltransferase 5-like [Acanthaster planci]|uniref:Alpha-N-acetylgalactosaminide alpha-2,6-sialyltransferase 5-like n=1 Tax=Acanthaster planci TaxID=133434 RepID=A0A8B7Z5Q9_ACAPL|nr:alpha-N-acetylgalactosaminide alpha-2,6-sialyltransferase 5-like [Acanthaster planci]
MKPLALYVAALGIVATLFVMSAMLSPMVSNPLHYGIISKKTHLLNSNAIFRGLIQRWRALPSSAGPPSVHGTLRFYRSMLNDQAITLKYSSCALVSSSGILQDKGAGQEIDRHACVIRMNLAPVKGHRRDVGTRTTVRVMNFLSAPVAVRVPMPDGAIFVWGLYLDNRTDYYRRKVLEVSKKYGHRTQIVSLTPDGEKHAESLFYFETGRSFDITKSRPSTGWYTMLVALDICEKIHVYGMVPADYCSLPVQAVNSRHLWLYSTPTVY